jgi:hypothetical protein
MNTPLLESKRRKTMLRQRLSLILLVLAAITTADAQRKAPTQQKEVQKKGDQVFTLAEGETLKVLKGSPFADKLSLFPSVQGIKGDLALITLEFSHTGQGAFQFFLGEGKDSDVTLVAGEQMLAPFAVATPKTSERHGIQLIRPSMLPRGNDGRRFLFGMYGGTVSYTFLFDVPPEMAALKHKGSLQLRIPWHKKELVVSLEQ